MTKLSLIKLLSVLIFSASISFAQSKTDPEVVKDLDVQAYMGLWYDIAHSPNSFQSDCKYSTAQYDLQSDGKIKVLNTCYLENNESRSIEGVASAVDADVPAKLKVDFGFLRKGDYWITKLGPNYEWALVSGPKKDSIFILSRQAPMSEEVLRELLEEMKSEGYRTDNLVYGKY